MRPDLFVGTRSGLFRLRDGRPERLAEGHFTALVREGERWWAVLGERELQHSEDGLHWVSAGSLQGLRLTALLPTTIGLLVGTSDAHLFVFREGGFSPVPSFETAPGRDDWYNPAAVRPDIWSLSQAPSGLLFVNVHVGGIQRSADGGRTWAPTIDIDADVHQVLFDAGSKRLLAATGQGLYVSDEHGQHWRLETQGLHASYLRSVAVAGDTVLVTNSTGPFTRNVAVYRKPLLGEAPFERCRQGLPHSLPEHIGMFCLEASGPAVAFGTFAGQVYLSLDQGEHWSLLAEELPPVRCLVLA